MAKCRECGKKGMFVKVDNEGYCEDCREEISHKRKKETFDQEIETLKREIESLNLLLEDTAQKSRDASKLLEEAIASANCEANRKLEEDFENTLTEYKKTREKFSSLSQVNMNLMHENFILKQSVYKLAHRKEKLKPLASSIQYCFEAMFADNSDENIANAIVSLSIEELLPEPELNCLSIKELKSRYNRLRKQIVDVCTMYESKCTTKMNVALYKLMILALESELEIHLQKLQYGKPGFAVSAVKRMTRKYYAIADAGDPCIVPSIRRFIGQIEFLYLEIVKTEYECLVQRERAKEEQRTLKLKIRQETEERKRLEKEREQVEVEEKKYQQEIDRITSQLQLAHEAECEALRMRLDELITMFDNVQEKKAEIINLENGKAGTVYIISNIGSFGDHVFKVGMTRRLEPQERVNELGDASVPFPFDVHSFIFSEDAVALEAALHHEMNDMRVNKVNRRKEFFDISIEELQAVVERVDPTAHFRVTALAKQYRQSLSITHVPEGILPTNDDDEIASYIYHEET